MAEDGGVNKTLWQGTKWPKNSNVKDLLGLLKLSHFSWHMGDPNGHLSILTWHVSNQTTKFQRNLIKRRMCSPVSKCKRLSWVFVIFENQIEHQNFSQGRKWVFFTSSVGG